MAYSKLSSSIFPTLSELVAVDKKGVQTQFLDVSNDFQLGSDQRLLNVRVAISKLGYYAKEDLKLQYQLDGGAWSIPDNGDFIIRLLNLMGGDHVLKIRLVLPSQQLSKETVFRFSIRKHWYETLVFWIFTVLLSGGVVVLVTRA